VSGWSLGVLLWILRKRSSLTCTFGTSTGWLKIERFLKQLPGALTCIIHFKTKHWKTCITQNTPIILAVAKVFRHIRRGYTTILRHSTWWCHILPKTMNTIVWWYLMSPNTIQIWFCDTCFPNSMDPWFAHIRVLISFENSDVVTYDFSYHYNNYDFVASYFLKSSSQLWFGEIWCFNSISHQYLATSDFCKSF